MTENGAKDLMSVPSHAIGSHIIIRFRHKG